MSESAGRSKRDGKSVLIGGKLKSNIMQVEVGETERDVNTRVAEVCPVKIIRLVK
jgi:ferredoxin